MIKNPLYGGKNYLEPRYISTVLEVNMSNSSAEAAFNLLGLEFGFEGSWDISKLPALIRRIEIILIDAVERASFIDPPCINGVPLSLDSSAAAALHEAKVSRRDQATVISFGRNDESIVRNMRSLATLLEQALSANLSVSWG